MHEESFITGVLTQNKAGAIYEGIVYDRRLVLRVQDGRTFSIFDFADPIGAQLRIKQVYTLVLVPFVMSVNLVATLSPSTGLEATTESLGWQGIVLDPDWKAPKDAFRFVRPEFYGQKWVLVATPHGNLLLKQGNPFLMHSNPSFLSYAKKQSSLK